MVDEITATELKEKLDAKEDFQLIDVRQPAEHAFAKIEGAKLIPMRTIPDRVAELEPYRSGRIVVHCHHGGRSARVTTWLRQQGFASAQNMTGGIDAWSLVIDQAVPRYK